MYKQFGFSSANDFFSFSYTVIKLVGTHFSSS